MWSCPDCGAQNPTEAAFCTQCGRPMQAFGAAPVKLVDAQPPKKKRKAPWIIAAAVLALALIGLGLWFFVFRTPHFRLVSYTYVSSSTDSFGEYTSDPAQYTYLYAADGRSGVVRNDDPDNTWTQSFTCDKNGALLSLVSRDEDGAIRSRTEYENDKWGNHVKTRWYNSENILIYYQEASYNRYKVAESIVATRYNDGETLSYQAMTIFSAPELGTYTETNANGSTVSAVIRRVYNDRHQLVQESWEYDDGTKRTYSYVRDEYYNVLSETRIYEYKTLTSTSTYTYVYERVR